MKKASLRQTVKSDTCYSVRSKSLSVERLALDTPPIGQSNIIGK